MKKCVIVINEHRIIFVIHNLIYLHLLQQMTFQKEKISPGQVVHHRIQVLFLIILEILDIVREYK
jgi:hypothetical protein